MNIKMYEQYIKEIDEDSELNKGYVIDVLNSYVNGSIFIRHLEDFAAKTGYSKDYYGTVFSNEIDEDSDEYFGENKVMFYYGVEDDDFDVVTYEECYRYLEFTAKFYIKYHKEEEKTINEVLHKIKKSFSLV